MHQPVSSQISPLFRIIPFSISILKFCKFFPLTLHRGLKDTLRKSRMSSIDFVNWNSQNFVFVRRDCKSIFLSISEICVSLCMLGISIFQIDIFTILEISKVCAKMFFQKKIFDFMHGHNIYYFKKSMTPISFDRTALGVYF